MAKKDDSRRDGKKGERRDK